MKHLTFVLLLIIFVSCKERSKPELLAQHADSNVFEERVTLTKDVLEYVSHKADTLALMNATVFDGNTNTAKENQTLIIVNGYFQAIGASTAIEIPKNATTLDLEGKTIIPGIVGVHNHLHIPRFPFVGDVASKLYLASGVTTIQTCGSASPQLEVELSDKIKKGQTLGPTIFTSGPYFTGPGGNQNMIIPKYEKQIRDTIQYWTKKGVRWFKIYRHTRPDDLVIILDEAHKQNAKVTGHLCSITFEQAATMGIDGIEHGLNSASDFRKNKTPGICDGSIAFMDKLNVQSNEVKKLQQHLIANDVFLTSTQAIYESSIPTRAFADERSLEILSPFLISQYKERMKDYQSRNDDETRAKRFRRIMDFEYQFYKMGGNLTAGVDAGRHVLPGFGDQRNFELLRETGFSTAEVIQIMTSNGAKALSDTTIGSIEEGKKADFVIIKGSVTDSISNVETVFKDGYGYDSQRILQDLKGAFGAD